MHGPFHKGESYLVTSTLMESIMSKRELIDSGSDKRYVRRDSKGRFSKSTDVGKSLATDQRRHSKTEAPRGQGDKGDRRKSH
jgi:hypothetical protein